MDQKYSIQSKMGDVVLVFWEKGFQKYSVHTQTKTGLVWGHYFNTEEGATEYFYNKTK